MQKLSQFNIRRNIKTILKKIDSLLVKMDLMNLVASGAPIDEYHLESEKIAIAYFKSKNIDEFKKHFAQVFIDSFDLELSEEKKKELEHIGETMLNEFKKS